MLLVRPRRAISLSVYTREGSVCLCPRHTAAVHMATRMFPTWQHGCFVSKMAVWQQWCFFNMASWVFLDGRHRPWAIWGIWAAVLCFLGFFQIVSSAMCRRGSCQCVVGMSASLMMWTCRAARVFSCWLRRVLVQAVEILAGIKSGVSLFRHVSSTPPCRDAASARTGLASTTLGSNLAGTKIQIGENNGDAAAGIRCKQCSEATLAGAKHVGHF